MFLSPAVRRPVAALRESRRLRSVAAAMGPLGFTRAYATLFLAINLALLLLPAHTRDLVESATSTNIAHLAVDPLFVLPASALIDQGELWLWIPLILLLVGGLESHVGTRRTVLAVFGAHTAASLMSEGILLTQILLHREPTSMLHVVDVGPSYMVLAALAACLVVGGWKLRLGALATGVLIVPGLLHGFTSLDMTAVGHVSALLLGAGFTVWLTRRFTVRVDRVQLVLTRLVWTRPAASIATPGGPVSLPGARVRLPLRPVAALVRPLLARLQPDLAAADLAHTSTITGTSMGLRR